MEDLRNPPFSEYFFPKHDCKHGVSEPKKWIGLFHHLLGRSKPKWRASVFPGRNNALLKQGRRGPLIFSKSNDLSVPLERRLSTAQGSAVNPIKDVHELLTTDWIKRM